MTISEQASQLPEILFSNHPNERVMLKIVDIPLEDLEKMLWDKNPRWMPDQQMESLQASLQEFGAVEPIIVNEPNKQVIGGHQRIKAAIAIAQNSKLKSLPAVLVDLDPARQAALNLLLNKTKGTWDYDKLGQLLAEFEPDQLTVTGFEKLEIDSILASVNLEDEIPDFENDDAVVRDIRNRTEAEVEEALQSTIKVQFGMFSRHIPSNIYEEWLEKVINESTAGSSPVALGAIVAQRLGIVLPRSEESKALAGLETVYVDVSGEVIDTDELEAIGLSNDANAK
jgi:hypothetical protein